MTVRRDPTKAMQIGFLALLSISAATVGWWMYDHVQYARSVEQRFASDPAVAEDSAARINRILWEGGFFLVVLIGGMAVLTRTLRHDAELRRRQQNFLAAVSHEFKSPLASIQLAAETLVLRSRDDDGKRLGTRILEDGERLLRMIDNLLDTTRLEEGRQRLTPQLTNLHAASTAAIAAIAERTRSSGVAVTLDVAARPGAARRPRRRRNGAAQPARQRAEVVHRGEERHDQGPRHARRERHHAGRQRRRARLSARGRGDDLREVPSARRRAAPRHTGHRARALHRQATRRALGRQRARRERGARPRRDGVDALAGVGVRPMKAPAARILVVDDEAHLAAGIRENLEAEGYRADVAHDGTAGLERLRAEPFDLVVLDVMMPNMDGLELCAQLRRDGIQTPVLFLTVKGAAEDRVRGFEAGGDDYLPKPFHLQELLLRVAAILRRSSWYHASASSALEFGGNRIDFKTYEARAWDGSEHSLTHKEAMILRVLADQPGNIVTREEILDRVWGYEVFPSTRTIDNFIVRLRKRFERNPEAPAHFHTVRGVGYRFTAEPQPSETPSD